jgi:hypothetical protein
VIVNYDATLESIFEEHGRMPDGQTADLLFSHDYVPGSIVNAGRLDR